jgi:hypothetical protein
MNTVLAWVIISIGGNYSGMLTYSPPMPSLQECERVLNLVAKHDINYKFSSQCVQMTIVTK